MKLEEAKDILSDMRDRHLCFLGDSEIKEKWQKEYLKESWACDFGAKALEKQIPMKVLYEDVEYYYIAKLNDTKTDIENNYKLVTIKEEDGNKILKEVTGVETLKKILPLFENSI